MNSFERLMEATSTNIHITDDFCDPDMTYTYIGPFNYLRSSGLFFPYMFHPILMPLELKESGFSY